ncbi:MAG: acetyl-CoA carboxylase biotin carboxyl carrier protein [Pirellulales bacterium]
MSNAGPNPGDIDIFDVKRVRRLVEMMKEHDLSELDLKNGDQRVRLRRGQDPVVTMPAYAAAPTYQQAAPAAAPAGGAPQASAPAAEAGVVIKSPMVGTFYTAPNPESPAFVKVGDHVGPESIVCVIEAMKVFNQLPAELSGQITAVLVENGQPVEFGQALFRVDPSK